MPEDTAGTFTVLHSSGSRAGFVIDAAGNLYGTTAEGIFQLDPASTFTVLASSAGSEATLALDALGNLYGRAGCVPQDVVPITTWQF